MSKRVTVPRENALLSSMPGNMVRRIGKDAQEISGPNVQVEAVQMLRFQRRYHHWYDVVDRLCQVI